MLLVPSMNSVNQHKWCTWHVCHWWENNGHANWPRTNGNPEFRQNSAEFNFSWQTSTVYLSEGSEFGSQLQKRHLCSLRRILGVKNSTTNWAVLKLRECGQEPLQFSGSVLPSGFLIACLIPTVRLYVVCWRQICILLLLIVLAGLQSSCSSIECVQWTAR